MNNFYNNTGIPNNVNFSQPVYNNQQSPYCYQPQQVSNGYIPPDNCNNFNANGVNNQFYHNQPINYGINNMVPNLPQNFAIDPEQIEKDRKKEQEKQGIRASSNKVAGGMLIFVGITELIVTIFSVILNFSGLYDQGNSDYINGIEPLTLYIINAINSLIGMGAVGIIITKFHRLRLDDVLKINKVNFSDIVKFTFAGMGFAYVFNILLSFMNFNLGLFGYENNMPSYGDINGIGANIIYYFAIAIVPPIAEEFVFRGAILGSLRKHGDAFAIIISALLFGFAHSNFTQTPVTFLTGLLLGYLTVKTNSIIPAIIIHFVNNSIAFLYEVLDNALASENILMLIDGSISILFLIVGFICTALLIKKYANNLFTLEKPESQLTMSQKLRCSFATPCMIIFTVYTIVMCVYTAIAL